MTLERTKKTVNSLYNTHFSGRSTMEKLSPFHADGRHSWLVLIHFVKKTFHKRFGSVSVIWIHIKCMMTTLAYVIPVIPIETSAYILCTQKGPLTRFFYSEILSAPKILKHFDDTYLVPLIHQYIPTST